MLTSKDRILTTHCGSLPRPAELSDLLLRQEAGEQIDTQSLHRQSAAAVAAALDAQLKAGIDIVSDGEQPRVGFSMYVPLRMEGFAGETSRPSPRDLDDFPLFAKRLEQKRGRRNRIANPPKAVGEVRYTGLADAQAEYDLFKKALASSARKPAETFMTAASPGIIATTMVNEFYDSYESYVFALARELRKEYELIVQSGFLLQLDAPDFGLERARMFKSQSDAEFLHAMELNVEAINRATEGIPRDRIRLHICWGNWEGPHTHDFPLAGLLPILYRAKVGALSIEFANPRHQHEYEALRQKPAAAGDDPHSRRDRHHDELRRASRGGGKPHLRGGQDGRRPQPRYRRDRLRLRHLGGLGGGVAGRGLGQACRHPRGRRHREPQALGLTASP